MFRGYGKRDLVAWTVIGCLVAFGTGTVLVKRLRSVGPMEFRELPASELREAAKPTPQANYPVPPDISGTRMTATRVPADVAPRNDIRPAPPITAPQPKSHSKAKAEPDAGSISLNAGQLADLEKLPGVGPGIAQRIIDYRSEHGPFQSLDELRNVKGIGEKRFAKMEPFLRL
jgi:competence protein ComEA